jgi:hypothetical protein
VVLEKTIDGYLSARTLERAGFHTGFQACSLKKVTFIPMDLAREVHI